ncbi:MAG: MFS transporter [Actinomycetota bacterium]
MTARFVRRHRSAGDREIFGWQMYDWAWSAFSTTVTTALLGPYLLELAEDAGGVAVGPITVAPASFFPFAVSASALVQVLILPLVGAVADHTDHKKRLMLAMAYAASGATAALVLVTGSTIVLGGILFVVASVGFGAAGVVYNSYLPEIAPPERRDRVSSGGFAYGYAGGGLWLAINFAMIALMEDTALAVRLSLGGTGLWAGCFLLAFTHRHLRPRPASRARPPGRSWTGFAFRSVVTTARTMRRRHPETFRYLLAYLVFNDGILTVIAVSTSFAADELDAEAETLLALVLLIQFVAVPGAVGFGRLAERYGAKSSLTANLVVWTGLVVYAYLELDSVTKLWVMGTILAFVLGGSQAISRSLYSQMIPDEAEAEYFGFYEIASRGTSWIGPAAFGIVNQLTGSQRQAILSLILFFVVGIALLVRVDVRRAMLDVGQDPSRLPAGTS